MAVFYKPSAAANLKFAWVQARSLITRAYHAHAEATLDGFTHGI